MSREADESRLKEILHRFFVEAPKVDRDALEDAIAFSNIVTVYEVMGVDSPSDGKALLKLARKLVPALRDIFEAEAEDIGDDLGIDFNPLDDDGFLDEAAAMILILITRMAQRTIEGTINRGFSVGLSPAEIADRLMEQAYLDDRSAAKLDQIRQRVSEDGGSIARVLAGLLIGRAAMIAASEVTRAYSAARRLIWWIGLKRAILTADMEVMWVTARDELVCPVCRPLDGTRVRLTENFPLGDPPLHPRCRCDLVLV